MYYQASVRDCIANPPPLSSPLPLRYLIKFKFSFESGHCLPGLYSSLIARNEPPMETFVELTLREIISYEHAYDAIAEKLRDWPIWGSNARQIFINFAMQQACTVVGLIRPGYSHVYLHIHLAVDHDGSLGEEELNFMREYEVCMVPCDDSSIEALVEKKVVMSTNSDQPCCVCLEELLEGSEAVSMPCQHVFHQHCIVKWLRTSHYCPLCRFEMPAMS